MKVRAIANNSVYDVADETVWRAMLKTGLYVVAEVEAGTEKSPKYKTKDATKYKRRDMTAEG